MAGLTASVFRWHLDYFRSPGPQFTPLVLLSSRPWRYWRGFTPLFGKPPLEIRTLRSRDPDHRRLPPYEPRASVVIVAVFFTCTPSAIIISLLKFGHWPVRSIDPGQPFGAGRDCSRHTRRPADSPPALSTPIFLAFLCRRCCSFLARDPGRSSRLARFRTNGGTSPPSRHPMRASRWSLLCRCSRGPDAGARPRASRSIRWPCTCPRCSIYTPLTLFKARSRYRILLYYPQGFETAHGPWPMVWRGRLARS